MRGTAGWAVAIFIGSLFASHAFLEHVRYFDPLYCKLYSSSPSKSAMWWEKLEGVACVEDRRTAVKGDMWTYQRAQQ